MQLFRATLSTVPSLIPLGKCCLVAVHWHVLYCFIISCTCVCVCRCVLACACVVYVCMCAHACACLHAHALRARVRVRARVRAFVQACVHIYIFFFFLFFSTRRLGSNITQLHHLSTMFSPAYLSMIFSLCRTAGSVDTKRYCLCIQNTYLSVGHTSSMYTSGHKCGGWVSNRVTQFILCENTRKLSAFGGIPRSQPLAL